MSTPPSIKFDPLALSDMDEAFRLWSDFETVKLTNWTHTPTRDECAQRMEKVLSYYGKEPRHFGPYAARLADNRFVGLVGADLSDASRGEFDVWYILRRDEWGKGIATQALGELLQLMTASGRVKRATATAVTSNAASLRLLEKHGFTREKLIQGGHQRHGLTLDLFACGREIEPRGATD
jgi:[ribosomal protein S5]-alanine N-acetyltransferase